MYFYVKICIISTIRSHCDECWNGTDIRFLYLYLCQRRSLKPSVTFAETVSFTIWGHVLKVEHRWRSIICFGQGANCISHQKKYIYDPYKMFHYCVYLVAKQYNIFKFCKDNTLYKTFKNNEINFSLIASAVQNLSST